MHRELYPALLAQRIYHHFAKTLAIFKKPDVAGYRGWYSQALEKDFVETEDFKVGRKVSQRIKDREFVVVGEVNWEVKSQLGEVSLQSE